MEIESIRYNDTRTNGLCTLSIQTGCRSVKFSYNGNSDGFVKTSNIWTSDGSPIRPDHRNMIVAVLYVCGFHSPQMAWGSKNDS